MRMYAHTHVIEYNHATECLRLQLAMIRCGSGCVCGYGCGCVRENERGRERGGKKFQPLLTNILSKNIDNEEMEDEDFQTYLEN